MSDYEESPIPHKRRRIAVDSDSDDGSASESSQRLPSDSSTTSFIEVDEPQRYKSKHEDYIHEPAYIDRHEDEFVTQINQSNHSSPFRMRGPRWRKPDQSPSTSPAPQLSVVQRRNSLDPADIDLAIADEFDDDDFDALIANQDFEVVEALSKSSGSGTLQSRPPPQNQIMRQTTLFGTPAVTNVAQPVRSTQRTHNYRLAEKDELATHHKINEDAMQKWIFPLNVGSIRDYQYNIVHKALFNNILVALPTGLGKTFIAATVMMNWFNWTKEAQIVFMAPTKPLVAQQVDACFHVAGIPRTMTTLMTGEIPSHIRADEWQKKRVFFMTPQTLINDLKTGIADPKKLVLLVVDEAHKATGGYAYTEVIKFVRRFNTSVRILALTATPGSTVEAVQKVIDGLDIARVEIRTEDSIDIQKFVHDRNTDLELFDYSEEITMCLESFGKAAKPVLDKICSQNAFWGKDPTKITAYGLMQAQAKWAQSEAGRRANPGVKAMIFQCFAVLKSLAHSLDLLKFHGIGPFYHKMKQFQDETGKKYANMIKESEPFMTMMNRVRAWINKEDFVGHPKLEYVNSVALNHFMDAGEGRGTAGGRPPSDTRIMVFTNWRDSAEEICRVLKKHEPMIRPHVFVGQTSTSTSEGMDQKMQQSIIKDFKAGKYNTLVATSIGEEGLDIGEVDLIVCYDCSKSPIRMLQRMGRTGRKRAGNIVMLLMREKEERDYHASKDNYLKMQEIIESGREFTFHEDRSPRIVPKSITPIVSKEHVDIPFENTQNIPVEPSKSKAKPRKKPAKKFHMPDGVEIGFTFLGQPSKTSARRNSRALDLVDADSPRDEDVFLSEVQEKELEENYAWADGTQPQYIKEINLDGQPNKLHMTDKAIYVPHSRSTLRLLDAMKKASSEQYDTLPDESCVLVDEKEDDQRSMADESSELMPPFGTQESLPDLSELVRQSRPQPGPVVRRRHRNIISDDEGED